jgi:hypothetical protein
MVHGMEYSEIQSSVNSYLAKSAFGLVSSFHLFIVSADNFEVSKL